MLDIDHEGNVIDVNKKGGKLPIWWTNISFILNNNLRMQTNTDVINGLLRVTLVRKVVLHDIVRQVVYKFHLRPKSSVILAAILNLSKHLRNWTCYTTSMLYRLHEGMKSTEKEFLQLVQGSAKMAFFCLMWSKYWIWLIRYIISQRYIQYITITIAEMVFLCLF